MEKKSGHFYTCVLLSFQVVEKHEKKMVLKPKIPAKVEAPPPAKGTVPPQRNTVPFVSVAVSLCSICVLPEFCQP